MALIASPTVPDPLAVQELEAHDAGEPVDAGDADAVVAHGANRARDMCAVEVIVERIARSGDRVEPVRAGGQVRLPANVTLKPPGPTRIRGQVGMCVVDAGVDDADDGVARSEGAIPRCHRPDVGSRRAGYAIDGLAGIQQSPQFGESRIVRAGVRIQNVVRLDVQDVGAGREVGDERRDVRLRDRARQINPAPSSASLSVSISVRRRTRSGDPRKATSTSPATAARPRNSSVAGRSCPGGR